MNRMRDYTVRKMAAPRIENNPAVLMCSWEAPLSLLITPLPPPALLELDVPESAPEVPLEPEFPDDPPELEPPDEPLDPVDPVDPPLVLFGLALPSILNVKLGTGFPPFLQARA